MRLMPKFSILDPELTYSVPPLHTKAGSFDVWSHCIDAYFSTNAPYLTDQISLGVMRTAKKYLPIVIKNPKDYEARSNLMWASTVALCGMCEKARENPGWMVRFSLTIALFNSIHLFIRSTRCSMKLGPYFPNTFTASVWQS